MQTADRLIRALERTHSGKPWHGPSRGELLSDTTWEEAAWRPAAGAHTIWDLVLHMRSWTREVSRRAKGGVPGVPEDGDWPAMPPPNAVAWKETLVSLNAAHAELAGTVRGMSEEALAAKVKDRPGAPASPAITVRSMVSSLAEHDIYHSGQAALLKRLARSPR